MSQYCMYNKQFPRASHKVLGLSSISRKKSECHGLCLSKVFRRRFLRAACERLNLSFSQFFPEDVAHVLEEYLDEACLRTSHKSLFGFKFDLKYFRMSWFMS